MQLLLFEHPMGYALIKIDQNSNLSLQSFYPLSPGQSLENQHIIASGQISNDLLSFLNLHNVKTLICDKSLFSAFSKHNIKVFHNNEMMRQVRMKQNKLLEIKQSDFEQSILALSHKYSRDKIEYDTRKEDNFIIQSYLVLEELEKDISKYLMRLKELCSNFFPELSVICKNDVEYCNILSIFIDFYLQNKDLEVIGSDMLAINSEEYCSLLDLLSDKLNDRVYAEKIIFSFLKSVGSNIFICDLKNIRRINCIIIEKQRTAENLNLYLMEKMAQIAPNLMALLGNKLGAKMISSAGGLLNLAKCPSSTLQVLGAEKSLFRALKAKSNTPKHGYIYEASGVREVEMEEKGKLCRFIASKCSIACRIDYFSEEKTNLYGVSLLKMVEDRIKNIKGGPRVENTDAVLKRVYEKIKSENKKDETEKLKSKNNIRKLEDKKEKETKKRRLSEKSKKEENVENFNKINILTELTPANTDKEIFSLNKEILFDPMETKTKKVEKRGNLKKETKDKKINDENQKSEIAALPDAKVNKRGKKVPNSEPVSKKKEVVEKKSDDKKRKKSVDSVEKKKDEKPKRTKAKKDDSGVEVAKKQVKQKNKNKKEKEEGPIIENNDVDVGEVKKSPIKDLGKKKVSLKKAENSDKNNKTKKKEEKETKTDDKKKSIKKAEKAKPKKENTVKNTDGESETKKKVNKSKK